MLGGDEHRGRLRARMLGLALTVGVLTLGMPLAADAAELSTADSPSATDSPPPTDSPSPTDSPTPTDSPSPTDSPVPTDSPTPVASPPPAPPAALPFAIVLPAVPVLTLPAGDGFRDALTVRLTAPTTDPVTLTAVAGTRTDVLANAVPLASVPGGGSASVAVRLPSLGVGSWTLEAAAAGRSVTAPHPLRVGSGAIHTLTLRTDRTTVYPKTPGAPSRVTLTVRAADETGASLPVHGTATVSSRGVRHTAAVVRADPGTGRLSVAGLAVGTAAVSARVTGPAGSARTITRSVTSAPTVLVRVSATRSSPIVQPVIDDRLDTVALTAAATADSGAPVPVHGDLRILRNGAVVRSWPLTGSAPHRVSWNGRVGGRIVVGTYRVIVRERGPDGGTVTGSTTVAVTKDHLPYRIRVLATLRSGNEQGLAIGRIGSAARLFVGVDVGDGNARIDEYDLTGRYLASSPSLPVGHAAELAQGSDGLLYVANGSASAPTRITVVNPSGWAVVRTIDAAILGVNGMIAPDPVRDGFLIFANVPGEPYTVTPMTPTTPDAWFGTPVPIQDPGGVPQGLDVVNGRWWVFTSLRHGNRISEIDPMTGARVGTIELAMPGEGEGEAVGFRGKVYVGCHGPNRFGVLERVVVG